MNHQAYYLENNKYSAFLDTQSPQDFSKYVDYLDRYSRQEDAILDVGCGTGIVIELLTQKSKQATQGVDISNTSIEICKQKGLQCTAYDGKVFPFVDGSFQLVGSYNVLEHTDDPIAFLNEEFRILKKGGYLIVACPNFLSVTNSYHYHTSGVLQKIKNLFDLAGLIFSSKILFKKMDPVNREEFQPDDDAVNVTNSVSILKWAKSKDLKTVYWSSQSIYRQGILNYLDYSVLRLFLGSSFFVFKK